MIYVDRSRVPIPEVLLSSRANAARERIAKLLSGATEKHLEQLRITFDTSVWKPCVPALMTLFHGKCAYCETPLSTAQPIDLEHFRPKQGAEDLNQKREHLYYSWLAYEWDNLLVACMDCNRRRTIAGKLVGKAQLFPLESPRAQVMASVADCRRTELPMLLDPCYDDPADHLEFVASGHVKPKTPRGATTIEILGLNLRENLVAVRAEAWNQTTSALSDALLLARDKSAEPGQVERVVTRITNALEAQQPHRAVRIAAFEQFRRTQQAQKAPIDPEFAAALKASAPPRSAAAAPSPSPAGASGGFGGAGGAAPPAAAPAPNAVPQAPNVVPPKKIADKKTLPPFAYQRIRRIEIRNFKVIESLDIDVPRGPSGEEGIPGALMMLGENATGKSTVLDAIALALLGTKQIAMLPIQGKDLLRRESLVDDTPPKHPASVLLKLDDSEIRLDIDLDGRFSGNEEAAVVLLGYGPRRFFSQNVKHGDEGADRVRSMFDPLVTLANPQQWLLNCSDAHFALAVRALRTLLLLPDEAVVERLPEATPRTRVIFELEGRRESLASLSEGYKTIVAMGVDIMRELLDYWTDLESAHGIVLIDELDTHLHPRWKMRIADRLRRALPEVQFLASTHDPLCLRGYHHGEVQVLRRDDDAGIERVADLPNVRGLSVQQLLTSEFFGLWSAEDPELEESVARYVTLASKRDRSASEDAELERQRAVTDEKIQLGATPQDRVMQQALNDYVVQRRTAPQSGKAQIERATVDKLLARMAELDSNVGVSEFVVQQDNSP